MRYYHRNCHKIVLRPSVNQSLDWSLPTLQVW